MGWKVLEDNLENEGVGLYRTNEAEFFNVWLLRGANKVCMLNRVNILAELEHRQGRVEFGCCLWINYRGRSRSLGLRSTDKNTSE